MEKFLIVPSISFMPLSVKVITVDEAIVVKPEHHHRIERAAEAENEKMAEMKLRR